MRNFLLFIIFVNSSKCVIYPSIPDHLLSCYRGGGPNIGAPKRLDVLLSLIRKIERNSQLDLRLFTASLLRSLRLDGIEEAENPVETEFVTPYHASAFQFHKYKLLMDLFLPSQNLLEIDENLSLVEKCLLHKMISSTVRRWERGDENVACPITIEHRQNFMTQRLNQSRLHSRCPVEEGVIQTKWGTVSPGIVIAAIASALEAQRVSVTDILNTDVFKADIAEPLIASAKEEWYMDIETLNKNINRLSQTDSVDISNIWVATLAGDLAEVIVNQGPRVGSAQQRMVIGSNNRWNDTLLPRDYYLFPQNGTFVDWHITDAEILAGVDGLILANYVPAWVEQRRSLRLSQIIEMYYSHEGVSFDSSVRACNRQALFTRIFENTQLLNETSRFANVLSFRQGSVYIPVEEMERISVAAVAAFSSYIQTVLAQYHKECQQTSNLPEISLIVATDGSWKNYDVEQFLSWVGGALEIDVQRGSLALLHGNTGRWISPPSNNLTTLFSHISNFTDEWPNRLNLPNIISSIIQYSQNETLNDMMTKSSMGPNTVVLIVSPSDRLSSNELERARQLMSSLRTTYFDIYFAYASQDLTDFRNINNEYMDYSELFLTTDSVSVQDVIKVVDTNLVESDISKRIFGSHCPVNDTVYEQIPYEDFVLPGRTKLYRIHPFYMRQQALISVQFRNDGQGQLLVCTWRGADASRSCQTLNDRDSYVYNITNPCQSPDFCPPAHFAVSVISTQNSCANTDCRLPHQVSFYIQHKGLKCLSLRGSAVRLAPISTVLAMFIIISFLLCDH